MENLYKLRAKQKEKALALWQQRSRERNRCDELWKADRTDEAMKCEKLVKLLEIAETPEATQRSVVRRHGMNVMIPIVKLLNIPENGCFRVEHRIK
jgi:Spy/CpxP family protein refolding chaperone